MLLLLQPAVRASPVAQEAVALRLMARGPLHRREMGRCNGLTAEGLTADVPPQAFLPVRIASRKRLPNEGICLK